MSVNKENVQKAIDFITKRPAEGAKMTAWTKNVNPNLCGTAGCIAGNINLMRASEASKDGKILMLDYGDQVVVPSLTRPGYFSLIDISRQADAGEFLGLNYGQVERLFKMTGVPTKSIRQALQTLDEEVEPENRKKAMIRVLEILRDTGKVDWIEALKSTIGLKAYEAVFMENPYYNDTK
jgi:hypothetical protein